MTEHDPHFREEYVEDSGTKTGVPVPAEASAEPGPPKKTSTSRVPVPAEASAEPDPPKKTSTKPYGFGKPIRRRRRARLIPDES